MTSVRVRRLVESSVKQVTDSICIHYHRRRRRRRRMREGGGVFRWLCCSLRSRVTFELWFILQLGTTSWGVLLHFNLILSLRYFIDQILGRKDEAHVEKYIHSSSETKTHLNKKEFRGPRKTCGTVSLYEELRQLGERGTKNRARGVSISLRSRRMCDLLGSTQEATLDVKCRLKVCGLIHC